VARARVHPRHQTTSTHPCDVFQFAGRKHSDHLPVHRRRVRFERFSVEPNASRGFSGPACPAAGETDVHASANVRFSRSTSADESGIDPVEFRLRNYADRDEHQNKPWSMKNLRECYERGATKFGWSKRKPKPGSMRGPDGSQIGFGMATAVYPAGQQKAGATASLNNDGTVIVRSATHEIG